MTLEEFKDLNITPQDLIYVKHYYLGKEHKSVWCRNVGGVGKVYIKVDGDFAFPLFHCYKRKNPRPDEIVYVFLENIVYVKIVERNFWSEK